MFTVPLAMLKQPEPQELPRVAAITTEPDWKAPPLIETEPRVKVTVLLVARVPVKLAVPWVESPKPA